jgi:hypothetical protein
MDGARMARSENGSTFALALRAGAFFCASGCHAVVAPMLHPARDFSWGFPDERVPA